MLDAIRIALLLPILGLTSTHVVAAEIEAIPADEDGPAFIMLLGEIEEGDQDRFRNLALQHEEAVIVLDSPGGAVGPALEIGRAINLSGYATVVLGESYCTSACALIWLAGSVRGLSSDAKLGFHASYRDENGVAMESGAANALVGRYLTQLGLSSNAILFATLAPPNDFLWLDESKMEESGISFRVLSNESGAVSAPNAPVPPLDSSPPVAHSALSPFEREISKYPKDWVERRAALNGMDVTPDGRIWFNSDFYGDEVDYGVAAGDLWNASGRFRKAWVRGYHRRDTSVPYRESLQLIHADCLENRWGWEMIVHYDADGKMMDQFADVVRWEPVVPRTYADNWHDMICTD